MTEAAIVTHSNSNEDQLLRPASVGVSVPVTQCKIMDPDTETEVPTRHVGEVWLRE